MKSSSPPGLFACNWMGKPTKEVWIILPLYPDPGLGARSCSPSDRTCDAAATGRFFSACTRCCRGFALFSSKFLATIRKLILDSKTLLQKTHHLVIKPCSWFASPSSLIPADDKPLFTNRFTCRYLSLYPCFLYSAVVPIFIHCCCVTSSWWPMSLHFFLVDPKKSNLRLGPRPQQLWFAAFHALRPRDLRGGSPWRQWVIWRQGPCRGESEMSLFEIKCIYIYIIVYMLFRCCSLSN